MSETTFEKDGFTMHMEMPHPDSKEKMVFDGWEAKYVTDLQSYVHKLEQYVRQLETSIASQASIHSKLDKLRDETK